MGVVEDNMRLKDNMFTGWPSQEFPSAHQPVSIFILSRQPHSQRCADHDELPNPNINWLLI